MVDPSGRDSEMDGVPNGLAVLAATTFREMPANWAAMQAFNAWASPGLAESVGVSD
jgi:hypothetical protein